MFRTADYDYRQDNDGCLQTAYMPSCCGVRVLTEFGYTDSAGESCGEEPSVERIKTFLENEIRDMRQGAGWQESAALLALNDEQVLAIGATVKQAKYKQIARFYHPSHESYISLFFRAAFRGRKDGDKQAQHCDDVPQWAR